MGGRDPNDYLRSAGEAGLRAAADAILGGDIEVDGRDAGEHRPNGHAKAPTHEPYNDDREFSRGVVEPLDPIRFGYAKSDTKAGELKAKISPRGRRPTRPPSIPPPGSGAIRRKSSAENGFSLRITSADQ
jgi:hypothetical protein